MIYLIGGAPRTGKSILSQQFSARKGIGWISTDMLVEMLRVKRQPGVKTEWDASPEAITAAADWFYPYLEHFIWGVNSHADSYLVEGVDFLPGHAVKLASQYPVSMLFLGCSGMTLERFDRFPGHSPGYAGLPEPLRRQMAQDIPLWSAFIQQEAARFTCPYLDMSVDFPLRLEEARQALAQAR